MAGYHCPVMETLTKFCSGELLQVLRAQQELKPCPAAPGCSSPSLSEGPWTKGTAAGSAVEEKQHPLPGDLLFCLQALPQAINMKYISQVAVEYLGLEVLSFNFLILQALCLFKLDGFHFYPFLCPSIKHFNPSNVKSQRCATAGNTRQGKSTVSLKWQQRTTKGSLLKK